MEKDYNKLKFLGVDLVTPGTFIENGRNHTYFYDTLKSGKEMITLEVFSRSGLPYKTYRVTIGSKEHLIYRSAGSDIEKLEKEANKAIKEEQSKINNFIKFVLEHKF